MEYGRRYAEQGHHRTAHGHLLPDQGRGVPAILPASGKGSRTPWPSGGPSSNVTPTSSPKVPQGQRGVRRHGGPGRRHRQGDRGLGQPGVVTGRIRVVETIESLSRSGGRDHGDLQHRPRLDRGVLQARWADHRDRGDPFARSGGLPRIRHTGGNGGQGRHRASSGPDRRSPWTAMTERSTSWRRTEHGQRRATPGRNGKGMEREPVLQCLRSGERPLHVHAHRSQAQRGRAVGVLLHHDARRLPGGDEGPGSGWARGSWTCGRCASRSSRPRSGGR